MNRFRFRFESVLRFREIIEERKKRYFGIALNHLTHEEKRFSQIKNSIIRHEKLREQSGKGKISAHDLKNKFNFAQQLDKKHETQKKHVEKAEEALEEKRNEVVESTKQKKIFERLKEHEYKQYEHEVRKEEQTLIDELSSRNFKNHPKK